jgi:hypothetical protein
LSTKNLFRNKRRRELMKNRTDKQKEELEEEEQDEINERMERIA